MSISANAGPVFSQARARWGGSVGWANQKAGHAELVSAPHHAGQLCVVAWRVGSRNKFGMTLIKSRFPSTRGVRGVSFCKQGRNNCTGACMQRWNKAWSTRDLMLVIVTSTLPAGLRGILAPVRAFSYKFPANGLSDLPNEVSVEIGEAINLCRLIVEIAQFNSERLDQSYQKNCKELTFGFNEKILEKLVFYQTDDYLFADNEDGYRIGRIMKKVQIQYTTL